MSSFDTLIRDGLVVDGTGAEPYTATIGIKDGRITYIGDGAGKIAPNEVNAKGKVVAPGWVDVHSHFDAQVTTQTLF